MAITQKIAPTKAEVPNGTVSTRFTTTGPFVLYGDGFGSGETAVLRRLGSDGLYSDATNEKGTIYVSNMPNMVFVDVPGLFEIRKTATQNNASTGYEEV